MSETSHEFDIWTASTDEIRKATLCLKEESDALTPELAKSELGRLIIEAESRRENTVFVRANGTFIELFGTWERTHPLDPRKGRLKPVEYREQGSGRWIRSS